MQGKRLPLTLTILSLALLAWMGTRASWRVHDLWASPAVLLFFFLAYQFDVHVPGLGYLNLDHVVAFPAIVVLQNPVLAGILAGVGLLVSRGYRRGIGGLGLVHVWGAALSALSIALGGTFYLALSRGGPESSLLEFAIFLAAMLVTTGANWLFYVLGNPSSLKAPLLITLKSSLVSNLGWVLLSSPLVALVVGATREERYVSVLMGSLTLLILVWAMRLYGGLQEKNAALIHATGRQEFLQQLSLTTAGSLENESFLLTLLSGLRDFVPWDRGLLLILPPGSSRQPLLVSLEGLPLDPHAAKETLLDLLEAPELKEPRLLKDAAVVPLLMERAGCQVSVAVATTELAFGVLVLERGAGKDIFTANECKFLELALAQIASHVQDEILKKQLMDTNRKLLRQTDYLSQILKISNLLKVHLDVQTILEKVAEGIREGMGFRTVLVSLYREDEQLFERVAQAGLSERWDEVRKARPPAEQIFELIHPRYRVGSCYFVGHADAVIGPYDILPLNPRLPKEPDDWDPMDTLLVPLEDKDGRLLGIISVDEPVDGKIPSLETLRALEVLANQTVNALESAQIHARTRRQAVMDGLTGLYNHGYFQEVLAKEARDHAESSLPFSVLMMDLDGFKVVNDTFGHLAGDEVLRAVAETVRGFIRREDIAARYGGEEFALFLPRCDASTALSIGERIRSAVEGLRVDVGGGDRAASVTLSVGLASFPTDGRDHHEILDLADQALYQAKRQGKNRVNQIA
ncbi:MAG: sensor domain-containing diguanylate cyclase [Acidobacteriota bacterium]